MSLFEKIILPIGKPPSIGGWVKWFHKGIPDEDGEEREDARNDAERNKHCRICTVLSGDYFPSFNMPMYPQHPNCDCILFSIDKPALQAVATCALDKFSGYAFLPDKSKGKTQCFLDWGFTIDDSDSLKVEFEKQARTKYLKGDYTLQLLNKYGQRITIAITLKTKYNKEVKFKTGWMVRPLGLITCATPFSGEIK